MTPVVAWRTGPTGTADPRHRRADRVDRAFKRNAIIDDSKIKVTNDGHTIYLTGVVGSYAAMRDALDTARQAPGVDNVVNDS